MRIKRSVLLAAVAVASSALGQQATSVPNEVIVRFRPGAELNALAAVNAPLDVSQSRPIGGARAYLLHSRSAAVATLVSTLKARGDVVYAEPNYIGHIVATPNDTYYLSYQWNMPKISAPAAWDVSTGSRSIVVGVVDTGIDYTHPDLASNVWTAQTQFTVTIGTGLPNPYNVTCPAGSHGFNAVAAYRGCAPTDVMDTAGHGTHVSGIIGAVGNNSIGVAGVNWAASIMALKVSTDGSTIVASDAVDAIEFATQALATLGGAANVRVLNNSYMINAGYSQALLDEINQAASYDMLCVAAAGNGNVDLDTSPVYPAADNTTNEITVAATDASDNLWFVNSTQASDWSPNLVHMGAPGANIISTVPTSFGPTPYDTYSGTSMAAAHVSGVAALVLAARGTSIDFNTLKWILLNSVDPDPALQGKTTTGGRLNAAKAIVPVALQYYPLTTPCRLVDTRSSSILTGAFGPPSLSAGGTRTLPIPSGPCAGISSNAAAYAVNITALPTVTLGVLIAWAAGAPKAEESNLGVPSGAGSTAAIVAAGSGGAVNLWVSDNTDILVDINGYFAPAGSLQFFPLTPCRVADTRSGSGFQGSFGPPSVPTGGTRTFPIAGSCSVPSGAAAYSLDVTAFPSTGYLGYLAAWPGGQGQPGTSLLNVWNSSVGAASDAAIVGAGNGGVSVFASDSTDVVIDVNGYFASGSGGTNFYTMVPCKAVDTRYGHSMPAPFGSPSLYAGQTRNFPLSSGTCGAPSNAAAFSLALNSYPSGYLGYLTAWGFGSTPPVAYNLTPHSASVASNGSLVQASGGSVNIYVTDNSDLVMGINGYFK